VNAFVSVHGTVSGVAACPQCNPSGILSPICDVVAEVLGDLAYLEIVQDILFQADYYRDPMKVNTDQFKKNSQLAQWNNEGETVHPEYATNFAKTNKFAMVKALADTMVFPNEGEHWGHFADDSYKTVLTMKETNWYKNDTFGLKTADEAGKIFFEQTTGNHLEFTNEELYGWIDKYFLGKN
jgi:palmitoyl-protein thioesterase